MAATCAVAVLSGVRSLSDEPIAASVEEPLASTTSVVSGPDTSAASTSTAPDRFGTTISCSGFSAGAMTAAPAIVGADGSVVLSLVDPSTSVWCVDGEQGFPLTFPVLSLRFDRLGCTALGDAATAPIAGRGIGIAQWDGGSSSLRVDASLTQPLGGEIVVTGLDGRLEDYRGTADFLVVGVDRPCEQGIGTAFVNLREITLRHTS